MSGPAFSLKTALGGEKLQLMRLSGEEALGELFCFDLEMSSSDTAIDFAAIVGQDAVVGLALAGTAMRWFHGVVTRFEQTGGSPGGAGYRAQLRPWLWWLTLEVDTRIYQDQSVPEIITGLFRELGFTAFRDDLQDTYAKREYCVQYNENAFAFVSRLMEDAGIFYFFEHGEERHTLVLADSAQSFAVSPGLSGAHYQETGSSRDAIDLVFRCETWQQAVPGSFAAADYNFETPATDLQSTGKGTSTRMRVYTYPGGYGSSELGAALVKLRMQALQQGRRGIRGASTCRAFSAACQFALLGHFRAELNTNYVLQRVSHTGSADQYSNSFEAFELAQAFRLPLRTPRARIHGLQTATVVGKAGEEIWTDQYGRVKLQFHWDRHGKKDENSSCWVRVAQGWAGQGWGTMFLPRIGQEVVVAFLDGDPDRPLVTGGVYNAMQTVPDVLPANQTRSVIRSQSSKGGGGANEIGFEDKKDGQELYFHAQKDLRTEVQNNRNTKLVAGNDILLVDKGGRSVTVNGAETHVNKAEFSQTVAGNFALTVEGDLTMTVSGAVTIKSGKTLTMEAGTSLTNKAGTSLRNSAGTSLENKAGTSLDNKAGTTLTNDAGLSLTNKGAASQTVDGGAMLTLKGGIVGIN